LHVGDSAFESWYSSYTPTHKGDKQRARDAYAAGMGDSLVIATPAAQPAPQQEAQEPVAWQSRTRPTWGGNDRPWSPWEPCTKGLAEDCWKTPLLHDWAYEARALYTAPQPSPAAQGDALDAARLDWLTFNLSGKALRDIGVVWSEHGDARRAIDAARAAQEGKSHDN
jgi:hypothetical protein